MTLIDDAARRWSFRRPRWNESPEAYRRALIDHVDSRDLAVGHELRIGRPQADWTSEDAAAFHARIGRLPGPRREFDPGTVTAVQVLIDPGGPYTTTEDSLMALARRTVDVHCASRLAKPHEELPIVAGVLLHSGELAITLPGRGERIAVLRALAQTRPVYGFLLAFDAFIHTIDTAPDGTKHASKRDAILCQVGTREMRRTVRRLYRVEDDRAIFDPPLEDLDGGDLRNGVNPYADIFVSVPPPTGAPS